MCYTMSKGTTDLLKINNTDSMYNAVEWCEQNVPADKWRIRDGNPLFGLYVIEISDPELYTTAQLKFMS